MTGDTDFEFLQSAFRRMRTPLSPINVFELSGFPRWETVATRVLAYFLNPQDERHRMGTAGVDALLSLLHGAKTVDLPGRPSTSVDVIALMASQSWTIELEAVTEETSRIDILMTNDDLDVAIVIENKLDAALNNPFDTYARHAAAAHSKVFSVLLAPTPRPLTERETLWISATLSYDEYFRQIFKELESVDDPDPRSLDLLSQFKENTSEKERRVSANAEATMLEAFWAATSGTDNPLGEFFKALNRVNATLRRRAEALHAAISTELALRHPFDRSWLVAGNDRAWGRNDGRVAVVYVAFELNSGKCIELMVGQYPGKAWTGFAVKAYPRRANPGTMFGDFNHLPLTTSWRAPDADIVAEFLQLVDLLEVNHSGT